MSWLRFPAVPPALAAASADGGRIKKRAGLPKLLHKLFVKVLCLRAAEEAPMTMSTAFDAACYGYGYGYGYGYRMGVGSDDEDYCYCYSYGSSWVGVLSSIPEEEVDDSSEEDVVDAPAVLGKASSERLVVASPEDQAATVVHVEVLL